MVSIAIRKFNAVTLHRPYHQYHVLQLVRRLIRVDPRSYRAEFLPVANPARYDREYRANNQIIS